ncbi:ThiJ/PfpI family protein [Calocera viscosa TUFC12733]|uniref:D-lactate dehydratase n=1 Tax=Calocera viscosa (strain TUFC12733) TaxID=1330018 RepID=A0A167MH90_CALVF|nr:ThiJ/PfpI family protein [Calocera viscosa TUFC12733]
MEASEAPAEPTGKILIILSDASTFPVEKKDGSVAQEESGVFVAELAKPLERLLDAGFEVTFASPGGKGPNLDLISTSLMAYLGNYWSKKKDLSLLEKMKAENNFSSPRPFASIPDDELESFNGVFIPGGHAPLADLGDNPDLGRILWHFHDEGKPTAALCHGPYALLSTIHSSDSPGFAYTGYQITAWSNAEERVIETMKGGTIPKVEDALTQAGAQFVSNVGLKLAGDITHDRELVTASNPTGVATLGEEFLEMLTGGY